MLYKANLNYSPAGYNPLNKKVPISCTLVPFTERGRLG